MKSKWIWLAACIAAAGAYLFKNNPGTLTVLICVVFLPIIGMLPLLFKPKLQMELKVCPSAEKNQAVRCKLKISNKRIIPVLGLDVLAQCRNVRTGQRQENDYRISLLPKQTKCLEFSLKSPCCGLLRLAMLADGYGDLFGLLRRKYSLVVKKDLTVFPTMFEPQIHFSEQAISIPDSDLYSTEKPGNDPGEIFAIREYIPGDAIRQIHWKLSEKCDKTMIREFGLQVMNDMLVLLETVDADTPEEIDSTTEVFASLCQTLSDTGVFFRAGWRAAKTDALFMQMVSSPSDFPGLLSRLMRLPPKAEGSVAERFMQEFDRCDFSHVIIVCNKIPAGVQELYNDNRISVLMPRRDGISDGLQADGTYIWQFDRDSYMADLSALEV